MKVLVTGMAGFIGYHVALRLAKEGHHVYGVDNINDYYDVGLKYDRLNELGISKEDSSIELNECFSNKFENLKFKKIDLVNSFEINYLFKKEKFDKVCHLAAQAGVRYSLENPKSYIDSNITGFFNILECCRHNNVEHLVYASSSSVYGNNKKTPFEEDDRVDNPISLYAATKKSNELMAYTYNHLYNFQTTGLRFFTVYGPWGRPDMAIYLFADAISNNKPIKVHNNGKLERDFTYIDDITEGVYKVLVNDSVGYNVYNIGNGKPVKLLEFINEIERGFQKKSKKIFVGMQQGDVESTNADTSLFEKNFSYFPKTSIDDGIKNFLNWYKNYN